MPYGLQRSVAGLGDAFAEANPEEAGHTCEAKDNVFSNGRCVPFVIERRVLLFPTCAVCCTTGDVCFVFLW